MPQPRLLALSFALFSALGATAAQAQDSDSLTRAQVVTELRAAQATGDVPHGDLDISARNGGPDDNAARVVASARTPARGDPQSLAGAGLTRAQVIAELHAAERLGEMPFGDTGRTMAEQFPQLYAAARADEQRRAQAQQRADASVAPARVAGG